MLPRTFPVALVASLAPATATQASALGMDLSSVFDDLPEGCTGLEDCTSSAMNYLSRHVLSNALYWGGAMGSPAIHDEYFQCFGSDHGVCTQWEGSVYEDKDLSERVQTELCTCGAAEYFCHEQAVPGNVSLVADGYCNEQNNVAACGWDGGDCGHGNASSSVPSRYCSSWSCNKDASDATVFCNGAYNYGWNYAYRRGRTLEDDTRDREGEEEQEEEEEQADNDREEEEHDGREEREGLHDRRQLRCYTEFTQASAHQDCSCTKVAASGNYCDQWYCEEETEGVGFHGYELYYGGTEGVQLNREWYQCQEPSENGLFCFSWSSVVVTNSEEWKEGLFQLASCTCTATTNTTYDSDVEGIYSDAAGPGVGDDYASRCIRWWCKNETWPLWMPGWTGFSIGFAVMLFVAVCGLSRFRRRSETMRGLCCHGLTPVVYNLVLIAWWFFGWWEVGVVGGTVYGVVVAAVYIVAWKFKAFEKVGNVAAVGPERVRSHASPPPRAGHGRQTVVPTAVVAEGSPSVRHAPRSRSHSSGGGRDVDFPVAAVQDAEVVVPTARSASSRTHVSDCESATEDDNSSSNSRTTGPRLDADKDFRNLPMAAVVPGTTTDDASGRE